MKYGFIGCGNMGGAIATALSRATKDIALSDRSGKGKALAQQLEITYATNEIIAQTCDRIFLGVKPHMMKGCLAPLQEVLAGRKPLLITMAAGLTMAQIQATVQESERKLLRDVQLFDVYEGDKLPEGKKSYAISITLQVDEKTLQDKQIDAVMNKIIANLQRKVAAELR